MKNIRKFLSIGLVMFTLSSCGEQPAPKYFSKDEHILNVSRLGYIVGEESLYDTSEFGLGSCDLGYPCYINDTNEMYYFFGDSFSSPNQTGQWKSNVVGISSDFNYKDGVLIDDALRNTSGYLKPIFNGHHTGDRELEVTKIPTGVIYINGVIYMYYFSMYDWSAGGDNKMNYGGCVKSIDKGKTWERIYDLTWVNLSPDGNYGSKNSKENLKLLINEDINNVARTENLIEVEDHYGFDATQIWAMDGKDGYIYLFLEGGYRNRKLKLGRVTYNNIEKFNEYEYMQKYDESGKPIYQKGYEGLKGLYNNNQAIISSMNFGEMSGVYNPYLKKYTLMTSTTGGVRMFLSDEITGPYSDNYLIYSQGDEVCPWSSTTQAPIKSAYAPQTHEKMLSDDGKVMYIFTSTWMPCYNPSLYEVTFK